MAEDVFLTDQQVSGAPRRRAFRVEIENPLGGAKSIAYHQEDVLLDASGNIVFSRPAGSLRVRFLPDLAQTVYTIADPVTRETHAISGAAIALWIEEDYVARATQALKAATAEEQA